MRTSDLETLVEAFMEAKATLRDDELSKFELHIVGLGNIPILKYFVQMGKASLSTRDRVLYGGSKWMKRYADGGFKFGFYDTIERRPVSLYIDGPKIQAYRFKKHIYSILDRQKDVGYFNVYAIGTLERSPTGDGIEINVGAMRHLCIILGPERKQRNWNP